MSSPSPSVEIPQFKATFISKEVKSTKVKELVFQISEPNYLEFLTIILAKHDKSQYRVTERKKYGFKYLVGNSRGRIEAMDVDNKEDYAEMAKKLISEEPQKVKVFVDMKNVEKLPVSTAQNETAGDMASQDSRASDDEIVAVDCTTELDREIARYRRLIIKKWGNSYDNSVTYVHQSGMEIPYLTRETTTPLTPHPARAPTSLPVPGIISPPALTPSMLTRFLKHAEDHLGVVFATTYKSSLCGIGAGPDILAEMADQDLVRVGLSAGDIIRLKKGSITWWNGPLAKNTAKRQRSDTSESNVPELKKFQYERRYHDGGRAYISGSCMKRDERAPDKQPELDYGLYYFCENRQSWVIFPPGYTSESEGEREDAEDPFI
ncbi:uncharacterized protein F5891DRAFT_1181965 [Suillus fuscotomentosus]|uniref:Uncharacterized protein n=1 Tax=Suillus fuscotomentosus TaxID=1912939 RepID=A0AAD4HQN8_9AGAM|nr:uncharacterized protein F5891DRAFT_1181965 [Suillus fuscotomentosus]KAG1906555.1 hypothetical protein F5891DRAFT_1181965 [Suillus fuscotomentosus]